MADPQCTCDQLFAKGHERDCPYARSLAVIFEGCGINEGETCGRNGCCGVLVLTQGPCYCAALGHMAPCSNCEESRIECDACGWTEARDQ